MRIVKQKCFDNFRCIADKCPDTCCQGWQIVLDEDAKKRFLNYEGELKDELLNAVDFEENLFRYDERGTCPLLNENGLCKLVIKEGEEFISEICHMYPRHVEEYDGVREWSLSISCPVAARMIIENMGISEYVVIDDDEEDPLYEDFEDFDTLLYTKLEDSRDVIFNILNNRELSIYVRIRMILDFTKELDDALMEDCIFDMDDIIDKYAALYDKYDKDAINSIKCELYDEIKKNSSLLFRLERLRPDWEEVLTNMVSFEDELNKNSRDLSSLLTQDHEIILEQLLHSYIYTYYLGAVYDDMIYAKCAMSVYSVLMMDYLYLCENGNENFDIEKYINVVYRFARETEHSDINLNMLEEECEKMFI